MSERDHDVAEITGTITLRDGSKSEFSIGTDFGWSQWSADVIRLGLTVGVLEGMIEGMKEAEVRFVSDYDEDEPEDDGEEGCDDFRPDGSELCAVCNKPYGAHYA